MPIPPPCPLISISTDTTTHRDAGLRVLTLPFGFKGGSRKEKSSAQERHAIRAAARCRHLVPGDGTVKDALRRHHTSPLRLAGSLERGRRIDDQAVATALGRRPEQGHQRALRDVLGAATPDAADERPVGPHHRTRYRVRPSVARDRQQEGRAAMAGNLLAECWNLDWNAHVSDISSLLRASHRDAALGRGQL